MLDSKRNVSSSAISKCTKKVQIERVMSFENSSVPLNLFKDDGAMVAADWKSDFLKKFEQVLPNEVILKLHNIDAIVFDAHAAIQLLPGPDKNEPKTCKSMAQDFINYILRQSNGCQQIHIVFDKYNETSTKNGTRQRRGNSGLIYLPGQNVKKIGNNFYIVE